MARQLYALYFGVGAWLIQLLHTYYTHRTYHQKEVRALEWLPAFSRRDPPFPERIEPLWKPWDLPPLQLPYVRNKSRKRRFLEVFGLQATNLVYCYLLSFGYGIAAFLVASFVVPDSFGYSWYTFGVLVPSFVGLIAFSYFVVGGSWATVGLEGNLILNLFLLEWGIPTFSLSGIITVYAVSISITAAVLDAWLSWHSSREAIDYGNLFPPGLFVFASFVYAQSLVIFEIFVNYG